MDPQTCYEMALDSRTGEEEAGNGAVLAEPCHRLRMDREPYIDPQGGARHRRRTAQDYEANLEANLRTSGAHKIGSYEATGAQNLHSRLMVRGADRHSSFEDKVAQRAVAMSEAVYGGLLSCSYGLGRTIGAPALGNVRRPNGATTDWCSMLMYASTSIRSALTYVKNP